MIDRASPRTIRDAIDDALAGDGGSMLEATAAMPLERAEELAARILITKRVEGRVRVHTDGPWLYINLREAPPPHDSD
jgi:hypothetical protein